MFLPGSLFSMLDTETDVRMRSDIQYTLTSMLQTLAPGNLTHWLGLCRDVLSATKGNKGLTQEQPADIGSKGEKDVHVGLKVYMVPPMLINFG
jgi:hypothetical protein